MICEVCGEDCRCGLHAPTADGEDLSEQLFQASLEAEAREVASAPAATKIAPAVTEPAPAAVVAEAAVAAEVGPANPENEPNAWRDEVSDRLTRYRAKRKPKPPRYPSLWLEFEAPAARAASRESVAHDDFAALPPPPMIMAAPVEEPQVAKILAFPRSSAAPPIPVFELADPVPSQPRILEVAETPAPPPALGGITIGQAERDKKRVEEAFAAEPASVLRRLGAAVIDASLVGVACAMSAAIFWQMTHERMPRLEAVAVIGAAAVIFWAAYQYLLLVYSGKTPGLWVAGLELACLKGSRITRERRRWRVLASYLSAASLGLGYAWALMEADKLAWHDRMTGTCIARKPATASK